MQIRKRCYFTRGMDCSTQPSIIKKIEPDSTQELSNLLALIAFEHKQMIAEGKEHIPLVEMALAKHGKEGM